MLATVCLGQTAFGQYGYNPPIYARGNGARTGGFRVPLGQGHLVMGAYGIYDSNALFADSERAESDLILELIPGLDFNRNRKNFQVDLSYRFKLRKHYELSIQDNLAHHAYGRIRKNFSDRFFFTVENTFDRTADPASLEVQERIDRWRNDTAVSLTHQSPGQDLENTLEYGYTFQKFDADSNLYAFYNDLSQRVHRGRFTSRFYFLPKSSLFFDGRIATSQFETSFQGFPPNNDSTLYSANVGIDTLLTRSFGVVAQAGRAWQKVNNGDDANSSLARIQINYRPNYRTQLSTAYQRDLSFSTFSNNFTTDRIYFLANYKPRANIDMSLQHDFYFVAFSGPALLSDLDQREDFVSQSIFSVAYKTRRWLTYRLQYFYMHRDTSSIDPLSGIGIASFSKHMVSFGVELYY